MARININVGTNANDGTGDDLRAAMQKINTNFTELYGTTAEANDLVEDGSPQLGGNLDLQNYIITTSATNGNITLSPNGTGNLILGVLRVNGTTISSDDSSKITLAEAVDVTGTLSADTIHVNILQSDDSTAIQINDSVNMSGTLHVRDLIVNEISSDDSTAVEIKDKLKVSGTLSAPFIATNVIFSNDSSEIQFEDSISILGTVSSLSISTNTISSPDSTRVNVDDSLQISGALYVNSIQSDDSTAVQINDGLNISGELSLNNNKIINVQNPVNSQDAATKNYVDNQLISASALTIVGDDSTGTVFAAGETVKFEGQGTTNVTVSGDTVYINSTGSIPPITFVGDDSTGTAVNVGETLKIVGTSNITTTMSGDTLTITGPNLSSYLTNSPITIVGDDSTGVTLNCGETIKIAGASNISTAVSGDILTITGPDLTYYATTTYVDNKVNANNTLTIADDTSTTGSIDLDNTLQVIGGNNITTSMSGSTLTITGDKSIDVNEINSGDSSAIQINDAVNISGTLNAKTIVTNDLISEDSTAINILDGMNVSGTLSADVLDVNEISSSDSSAIQINSAVNISGILTTNNNLIANNLITNEISSSDSTAIQINDAVNVSGVLSTDVLDVNEISSGDSSAIQINDSVNITGNLSVDSMDVNSLTSTDSSQLIVTDNFRVDGYLQANQLVGDVITLGSVGSPISGSQTVDWNLCTTSNIWLNDTTTVNFTNGGIGTRKITLLHNTAGVNKVVTVEYNGANATSLTLDAGTGYIIETYIVSPTEVWSVIVGTIL